MKGNLTFVTHIRYNRGFWLKTTLVAIFSFVLIVYLASVCLFNYVTEAKKVTLRRVIYDFKFAFCF